jgi:hypothetical protein
MLFFLICVVFLYCYICSVSYLHCKKYGLKGYDIKITPKKYKGKSTPIYKMIAPDLGNGYYRIEKFELLYTDIIIFKIFPYPIYISKLNYKKTYKTSLINKYIDSDSRLGEKSYDNLVLECEKQISNDNKYKMEELAIKQSLTDLNKNFNQNFG